MSKALEAISSLRDAYLMFPAFDTAHRQMESNLEIYRRTGHAQHLLVLGESGAGKTTLARMFVQRYPPTSLPECDVIPALYVAIPPAATIAGTVEAILAQLGDPAPAHGTVSIKTARAVTLARACHVEMLLIDEAQHIQDRGRSQTQYFVGDWLKAFMDALGTPVTMLGLPRTRTLLQVNEQLRRRFTRHLALSVHPDEQHIDEAESLELFTSLASGLPVSLNPRPYSWQELGLRLHFATASRIAYVKQLLIGAVEQVEMMDDHELNVIHLEQTFSTLIWSAGIGALNPFNPSFVFRSLDRVGEPFHREEMVVNVSTRRGRK